MERGDGIRLEAAGWGLRAFASVLALLVASSWSAEAAVFVVSSTGDTGAAGTLRWAVSQANANPGFDRIHFNVPGAGVHTIVLTNELFVNESADINAKTQPGYAGSPLVEIDVNGRNQAFFLNGQVITIQGFSIRGFASNGITINAGSDGNWIQHNWIGFDSNGATDSTGFEPRGIGIGSSHNVIRGNVISGVANGITLGFDISSPTWTPVEGNYITQNFIGLDPTGSFALANQSDGIFLGAGAASNFLGPQNVISGNQSAGIEFLHPSNQWNVIFDNFIGLNAAGDAAIPNGELAILLSNGASRNAIGGSFGGNRIAGNQSGILIGDVGNLASPTFSQGWGNWIQNNIIGADAMGNPLGNALVGIHLRGAGSYWNTISENVIVSNGWWGIFVQGAPTNWIDNNFVGVDPGGAAMGNGRDGILLDGAGWNTIIYNTVKFNGTEPGFPWQAIREANGSHSNGFWMNDTSN